MLLALAIAKITIGNYVIDDMRISCDLIACMSWRRGRRGWRDEGGEGGRRGKGTNVKEPKFKVGRVTKLGSGQGTRCKRTHPIYAC